MSAFFLKIVNMSIAASWLVLAVLLLRLVLKKAPKWIRVLLWGIVAVRLICPFSIESMLSLIPSAETIHPDIMMDRTPQIHTGINSLNSIINPIVYESFAPNPVASMNPLQLWIPLAAIVWSMGIAAMLIYTTISYLLLRRKVATAILLKDNIYQSENVDSPFVLGIIKPKIYLPFRMKCQNMEHVIAHEQSHIRRKDHWWKPFGFLLLTLHWFNPLLWVGYILLCRDIELACDEKVIKELDSEHRADYTAALVSCSVSRRSIAACPLAFGEVGVKERVKSVMNYKKPAFWIVLAAVVTCIVVAVCFLTDPVGKNNASVNYDVTPPEIQYPWVQEYTPGIDGIVGNVDTEKYTNISPDFAIGANRLGIAVFKDPHKAFMKLTELYPDAIAAIQQAFDLPPLSAIDYEPYKTYGWQITTAAGSKDLLEQATFVTQFFDIYENSFIDDVPNNAGAEVVNTFTTGLKTYYELSDGTWQLDGHKYLYRLEITGRMHDAAVDSTFVYLSNLESISFERACKAAGLSSNSADYFDVEEAVLVDWISSENTASTSPVGGEDGYANGSISGGNTFIVDNNGLENAIKVAILNQNADDRFLEKPTGLIASEAHQLLGLASKSGTPLVGQTNHVTEITVYVQYVYHRYGHVDGELNSVVSTASPAVLTFRNNPASGYTLLEFSQPNGGETYQNEVRSLFPEDIADILLDPQNDVINMEKLESDCLEIAKRIARLKY